MHIELRGRARVVGDDINADYIITSSRKRETIDASLLRHYLLETIDPSFAASVGEGDLLVAGRNFGCGSAMEVAATVLLGAGIKAVIAQSFARTFYRNAVNNGLLPIECDTSGIREGGLLIIRLDDDRAVVEDVERGLILHSQPLPPIMLAILECGGLVESVRRYGSLRALARSRRSRGQIT